MNIKIKVKIMLVFITIVLVSCVFPILSNKSIAADDTSKASDSSISEIVKGVTPYEVEQKDYEDITTVIGNILGFFQVISGITTVVMLSFIGINYIIETPEELKAEAKKKLLPIVVGIVLIFGATSIAKFLLAVAG